MDSHLLEVQQAGLGILGWVLVFFVIVPLLGSMFKGKNDDEKPKMPEDQE